MVWPGTWCERLPALLRASVTASVRRPNPGLTPEALLAALGAGPVALLDGVACGGRKATLVAWEPLWRLMARCGQVAGEADGPLAPAGADPLALAEAAAELLPPCDAWPLGIVSVLGFEALSPTARSGERWPDAWFLYPGAAAVFEKDTLTLIAAGPPEQAASRLARVEAQVAAAARTELPETVPPAELAGASLSPAEYEAGVRRIAAAVERRELDKAVLSVCFDVATAADPVQVYRRYAATPGALRFYVRDGGAALLGVTPELLVRLEDGRCVMRPLAGTRRRGHTPDEDAALLADLHGHPKDAHEHLVAVDQALHDLGAVCEPGSVRVTERLSVEIYPTVMHLASQVEGRLQRAAGGAALVRACFPAGTVAGVPRQTALALLEAIETVPRGPYGGGIGYWQPGGDLQLFLAIRCLLMRQGVAHVQTGAGIVAGSDPASEYRECCLKATGALRALGAGEALPVEGRQHT